jgi:hypothetical protein
VARFAHQTLSLSASQESRSARRPTFGTKVNHRLCLAPVEAVQGRQTGTNRPGLPRLHDEKRDALTPGSVARRRQNTIFNSKTKYLPSQVKLLTFSRLCLCTGYFSRSLTKLAMA